MISLCLATIAFIAIHLGVSGTRFRDAIVKHFGLPSYMVGFSLASVAALVWMVLAYRGAPYHGLWGQPELFKPVAIVLMLPAFLLVVIGLTTPNPTAVAQESLAQQAAQGIVCVTRHPFLMGVALWSMIHLIANGDLASLLFFGGMAVVSFAGPASIDAKRRRSLGPEVWDAFAGKTSIVPFKAIIEGRTAWRPGAIGWWRPASGAAAYVLMLGGHLHIIGVSPFP